MEVTIQKHLWGDKQHLLIIDGVLVFRGETKEEVLIELEKRKGGYDGINSECKRDSGRDCDTN